MKGAFILFTISYIASLAHGTCVFESDFGFILNCNFKKSGLFRVRNLGGLKAHFGLGFSLGDELGFAESIGNLEGNRRRALNYRTGAAPNDIGVLPASKLPNPNPSPQSIQKSLPIALTPSPQVMVNRLKTNAPSYNKRSSGSLMTQAASLPLGVPAFKPIPPKEQRPTIMTPISLPANSNGFIKKVIMPTPFQPATVAQNLTFMQSVPIKPINQNLITNPQRQSIPQVPPFHAMPTSVSRVSTGNILEVDNVADFENNLPKVDLMGHTVEELAVAANVSVEAIRQAIFMRQQQLLVEQRAAMIRNEMLIRTNAAAATSTTTLKPTTTTVIPTKRPISTPTTTDGNKVMNAPKEYYPVGYEKNFDDNFTSKVDLPPTSFHCGDQKHFPGLYADLDLGCMVFHVCALTDDGLIMKSFLCPESTLFDQTVLKCNWWFYVDCKSSKDLYDSNIPISKSYQLMKSLTYFSNYKNSNNENDSGVNIEALKNTVSGTNPT